MAGPRSGSTTWIRRSSARRTRGSPHINEVTYPSFLGYDKRDLQRLQAGYARVGRTIMPVPATCVANRLEKLILEKDWKEASGGLASFSSFQRLFGRLFSSGAAPACAPYLRQLS